MMNLPYCVNFWGSHPDLDNDDCWTGEDYATLAEARVAFETGVLGDGVNSKADRDVAFIEIDGPDINEVRANPSFIKRRKSDDSDWRNEIAMQAGMEGGCDAYNDAMGY